MNYQNIKEAIFVARPNRFIAKVIVDGEMQTVHVKNTGRCKELLHEGVKVYLEDHGEEQKTRKTRYSLVTVEKKNDTLKSKTRLVNLDSYAPNKAALEALLNGKIVLPGFGYELTHIKPETTYGASRFDFYVEDGTGKKAYIEVKGVTLEEEGVVRFPDAPTERGIKHIKELCHALEHGFSAYLIFVIQMKTVSYFEPNDVTHLAFGEALREAQDRGVRILAFDCDIKPDSMTIGNPVEVRL